MKTLVKTFIGEQCTVTEMPKFRNELARLLFYHICSNPCVGEAGIDSNGNIYFAWLNGNIERYNRKEFLQKAKTTYVSVDFRLKNENGNPEYLGPQKYLNYVGIRQFFRDGGDTYEKEDYIETGYVFEQNTGYWNGMNWTGKRFLINRDCLDSIHESDYQSTQVWGND